MRAMSDEGGAMRGKGRRENSRRGEGREAKAHKRERAARD